MPLLWRTYNVPRKAVSNPRLWREILIDVLSRSLRWQCASSQPKGLRSEKKEGRQEGFGDGAESSRGSSGVGSPNLATR